MTSSRAAYDRLSSPLEYRKEKLAMPDTSKVATLKSDTPGTVLLVVLYLGLGLSATTLLCSIVQLVAPEVYSSIEILADINALIELPMLVIAAILFLVW